MSYCLSLSEFPAVKASLYWLFIFIGDDRLLLQHAEQLNKASVSQMVLGLNVALEKIHRAEQLRIVRR